MGDSIQISRLAERFSSHTQVHRTPRRGRTSVDTQALRQKLVEALVETLAEGGDPRLLQSRALP